MKHLRLLLLVLLGIVLGFAIRTYYELASFDRAESIFDLFEGFCLADPRSTPEALGLVAAAAPEGDGARWTDPATSATVLLNGRICCVGTAGAPNLSHADAERWTELAGDAAKAFPTLAFAEKAVQDGDTYLREWMQ